MLYNFQALSPDDVEFEPTIKKLMSELEEHIAEEEKDDLPALEAALPEGESETLATSFQRTKMFVPTRSHPSAPDKPVSRAGLIEMRADADCSPSRPLLASWLPRLTSLATCSGSSLRRRSFAVWCR